MFPRAKKSYGQNFLVDTNIVRKIVAAAEIVTGEAVLEVGPGTGALTGALAAAGARVTAVEADRDLVPALRKKFGDDVELVEGDILFHPLPTGAYKLVANIPYNITSTLLNRFLVAQNPPSRMVLMVQREVADRIVAAPPDMSLLSVACQLYADVSKVANVPAGAFRPAPKVDSAVVRLDVRRPAAGGDGPSSVGSDDGRDSLDLRSTEAVIRIARAGFSARRKQLHGNLSSAGIATSKAAKDALASMGLPSTARAENLTVHNWIRLSRLL